MKVGDIQKSFSGYVERVDENTIRKNYNQSSELKGHADVLKMGCLERDIYWLKHMENWEKTPKLISYDDESITMSYMGKRIEKDNLPDDWREQMSIIISGLKKYGCSHNDIKPSDILVLDDKINLVDFGWATKIGEEIPTHWPKEMGLEYRFSEEIIDDCFSLNKSLESLL